MSIGKDTVFLTYLCGNLSKPINVIQIRRFISSRLVLALILLAFPKGVLVGQNNPYGIDDDCYRHFTAALSLVGRPGFDEQNDSLLTVAIARNDDKAQVLHYILKLRSVSRDPDCDANRLTVSQKKLMDIAEEKGYMQYYFQSYETIKNYYFNSGLPLKSLEIIQNMRSDAIARDNEYGMWLSDNFMSDYYSNYGVHKTARRYISRIIDAYNKTDDPTIRRQSISPYYRSYAQTFAYDIDSARYYLDLAWKFAVLKDDTVQCHREYAKYYAARGDYDNYVKYRDLCLGSNLRSAIGRLTPRLFKCIDDMYGGNWDYDNHTLRYSLSWNDLRLLSIIAEAIGMQAVSINLKDMCMDIQANDFSHFVDINLAEMEASYGNELLRTDLAQASVKMANRTRLAMALAFILLFVVIIAMFIYMRNLKRTKEKDEQVIAELSAANEQVRLANESKTRFLQNMTHEIRTPMNAISGFSQLLATSGDYLSPEEKAEFSGYIINNTRMMSMLLDDIIASQQMDKDEYKVTLEMSDCENICRNAMMAAEHRLQPGVQMLFVPSVELPFSFVTDPMRTAQVLTNLLTNACKHTKQGEIRLGCSLNEVPGMIAFSVEDTGPGIPESEAEHIFERFVKLDSFVQGTGLGLSISREIAASMGGNVFLDTSYSPGARFVFTLPEK